MKTKSFQKDKISVITLGCSKNIVDSEVMMSHLRDGGYDVIHDKWKKERRTVVVNTCGFIDKAKEESIQTILQYADAKTKGKIDKLYVTGCLSQRYKDNLEEEIPEVDAFFGTAELPALLKKFKINYKEELVGERFLTTPAHFAYLKISEGCNRTCSFCAIPQMRGLHQSKPIEQLVAEASSLAAQGVKELILIAQELTYYGLDIYKRRKLPELLSALSGIDGIHWIRLHYAYPAQFPMEIIDEMARNPKVCHYLDIPLQHASDAVLKKMKRNITNAETIALIDAIRVKLPDIAIRTTMLVGHPGETAEAFEELKSFVEKMRFERLGVFTYSHEEGTKAYTLPDEISEEEKQNRAAELMAIQEQISYDLNQEKIGREMEVIIDRKEAGCYIGRTQYDSPEVDNEVIIETQNPYIKKGKLVKVKITKAEEFDLYGEITSVVNL